MPSDTRSSVIFSTLLLLATFTLIAGEESSLPDVETMIREQSKAIQDQVAEQNKVRTLAWQRQTLADLETSQIAPMIKMHGEEKYGAGDLARRLNELKQRTERGEVARAEVESLKADTVKASADAWADYKAAQGWNW